MTLHHFTVTDQTNLLIPGFKDHGRPAPEKTVTTPFLSSLHTLQKERKIAVVDLAKRRDRGLHIGKNLFIDRDQVSLSGSLEKLIQRRVKHKILRFCKIIGFCNISAMVCQGD